MVQDIEIECDGVSYLIHPGSGRSNGSIPRTCAIGQRSTVNADLAEGFTPSQKFVVEDEDNDADSNNQDVEDGELEPGQDADGDSVRTGLPDDALSGEDWEFTSS